LDLAVEGADILEFEQLRRHVTCPR
jgi:hypothetical protein